MRTTDDGWDRYVDHLPVAWAGWEEGVERETPTRATETGM
jgi:hypothetical protein